MFNPITLTAYYTISTEKHFFEWLESAFPNLLALSLSKTPVNPSLGNYLTITPDFQVCLHSPFFEKSLAIPDDYKDDVPFILSLSQQLTAYYQSLIAFLDAHPLKIIYYDHQGRPLYDNKGFDGDFLTTKDSIENLEDWILEQVKIRSDHQVTVTIPSSFFDQVLVQHYQGLWSQEGHFQGVFSQILDLRPLLATYLEESGQALVGWSDTTSGASLSNGVFDD